MMKSLHGHLVYVLFSSFCIIARRFCKVRIVEDVAELAQCGNNKQQQGQVVVVKLAQRGNERLFVWWRAEVLFDCSSLQIGIGHG